jgi:hypothetical protein
MDYPTFGLEVKVQEKNDDVVVVSAAPVVSGEAGDHDPIRVAMAERVRSDSRGKGRLTSDAALSRLASEAGPTVSATTSVIGAAGFEDIKSIRGADGSVYFFSEEYLPRREAERFALAEEVRSQVVTRVRRDSADKARLTPLVSLGRLIPGAESDKLDGHLPMILDDERYGDVRLVSNGKGARYFYSADHMTETYAVVLARAEANDPKGTIVATVREESRIYPRPTKLSMFGAPVFNIDPDQLPRYAREIVASPEYADIKLIEASTGTLYLYSDTSLSEVWVRSTVEWEEVGQLENP